MIIPLYYFISFMFYYVTPLYHFALPSCSDLHILVVLLAIKCKVFTEVIRILVVKNLSKLLDLKSE